MPPSVDIFFLKSHVLKERMIKKKGHLEVEVLPNKFKMIVEEGGFEDDKVVLKELKKSGYLECEKDRYTRKRETQAGIKIPLIVVKISTGNKNNKLS